MKVTGIARLLSLVFAAFAFAASALAQQNWRFTNSLPATIPWNDAAYGNGVYVVVGLDATIATSPDGITWTIRRMSTAQMNLNAVAFANGKFIAVGGGTPTKIAGGLVMTSTNGSDWTINETVAGNTNAQFFDIVYGNNVWVITGSSSTPLLSSADGVTWTSRSVPGGVIPGTGSFGNGRFVFSGNGNTVITSTDGITWTRNAVAGTPGASSPYIGDVAFGGGKFVAIGRDSSFNGAAYTSADAVTWTAAPAIAGSSNGLDTVASDGAKFAAVGNAGLFSSADGTTWTKQTSPFAQAQRNLGAINEPSQKAIFANNQFFLLGGYGSIATSPDGVAWTRRSTGTTNDLLGAIYDGSKFVVTGAGGTVLTSSDGSTWTQVTSGTTAHLGKTAFDGTRYATANYSGILHSTNLTSWTLVSGTSFDRYYGVVYGAGKFVAAYDATTLGVRTSTDGSTWSAATNITGAGGNTNGLIYANNIFVLTMAGFGSTPSKIYSSPDGTTWTQRTPSGIAAGIGIESLAYGNGRFVILLGDRHSVTSTDGMTWTINNLPTEFSLTGVQFAGSKFFARSSLYGAQSYVSSDGVTWTLLENSTAPNNALWTTANNGSVVVGISYAGMILTGDIAGAAAPMPTTLTATLAAGATVQWQRNGSNVAGATGASLTLADVQPSNAGLYAALVTAGGTTTSQPFVVGVTSSGKFVGPGEEILSNQFVAFNNNTFDQIALKGTAATITADANQITRMSFIDMSDDIVQVEFSGAGSLTLILDGATGPVAPAKYNQPGVTYYKGHAGIVIVGADESTNVSVFSVGTLTAANQSLFPAGTTYDGLADVAFIAISSTNGKFGGIRTSNASYFGTKGFTGIYAPGIAFTGPVFVGDINAFDSATPVLMIGSSPDTRVTGGDLLQTNGQAISVTGLTQLKFTAGTSSHNVPLAAKTNLAVLKQGATDVTSQIVVNPSSGGTGKELTFFAGTNPPYANGAKKSFVVSLTSLQFDSTTLSNPTAMSLNSPFSGATFTDAATGIQWEVIFNAGVLHEINLMKSGQFLGQWQ